MHHPNRKPNRLPQYDYSLPNYYFVTICTYQKQCLFGTPEHLNGFGQVAADLLLSISTHFPSASIDKYVVMPNHIHAIIILRDSSPDICKKLSVILGQYKAAVSQTLHRSMPGKPSGKNRTMTILSATRKDTWQLGGISTKTLYVGIQIEGCLFRFRRKMFDVVGLYCGTAIAVPYIEFS